MREALTSAAPTAQPSTPVAGSFRELVIDAVTAAIEAFVAALVAIGLRNNK